MDFHVGMLVDDMTAFYLALVDHGDGYMTLYGYNETILKSAGDWVAPGDVLATVGDSGGQCLAGMTAAGRSTAPCPGERATSSAPTSVADSRKAQRRASEG